MTTKIFKEFKSDTEYVSDKRISKNKAHQIEKEQREKLLEHAKKVANNLNISIIEALEVVMERRKIKK